MSEIVAIIASITVAILLATVSLGLTIHYKMELDEQKKEVLYLSYKLNNYLNDYASLSDQISSIQSEIAVLKDSNAKALLWNEQMNKLLNQIDIIQERTQWASGD